MKKSTKNLLLLGGLGVGAYFLLGKKSSATESGITSPSPTGQTVLEMGRNLAMDESERLTARMSEKDKAIYQLSHPIPQDDPNYSGGVILTNSIFSQALQQKIASTTEKEWQEALSYGTPLTPNYFIEQSSGTTGRDRTGRATYTAPPMEGTSGNWGGYVGANTGVAQGIASGKIKVHESITKRLGGTYSKR